MEEYGNVMPHLKKSFRGSFSLLGGLVNPFLEGGHMYLVSIAAETQILYLEGWEKVQCRYLLKINEMGVRTRVLRFRYRPIICYFVTIMKCQKWSGEQQVKNGCRIEAPEYSS